MDDNTNEPVVVYVSQGPWAAEVAKSKLEAAGVPVLLRYESIGRTLGLTVDGLGRVDVAVPPEYADQARELLEESDDEALPPDGLVDEDETATDQDPQA
jgi:hypothetical protein